MKTIPGVSSTNLTGWITFFWLKSWVNFWVIFDMVEVKTSSIIGPNVNLNNGPNVKPTLTTNICHIFWQQL